MVSCCSFHTAIFCSTIIFNLGYSPTQPFRNEPTPTAAVVEKDSPPPPLPAPNQVGRRSRHFTKNEGLKIIQHLKQHQKEAEERQKGTVLKIVIN